MKRCANASLAILLSLGAAACQVHEGAAYVDDTPPPVLVDVGERGALPLLVSYRILMTGMTGAAGFQLFRHAGAKGSLTEKEWSEAGKAATDLVAIATLLSLEGDGKHDRARHRDPHWRAMSRDMQAVSVKVAIAASKRDRAAFQDSLGTLGDSCQACHARFMEYLPRLAPELVQLPFGESAKLN